MKYPAYHFTENDPTVIKSFIETYPLATLISVDKDEIFTTYLPLLWNEHAALLGHLDAQNPQASQLTDGRKVKIIFHGPEGYISPSHFTTNELPTYNYCKVEVTGRVACITEEELKNAIIQLTKHLEGPEAAYQLTHKEGRLHSLIPYIYGFKVSIETVVGRFKMSQDKSEAHRDKAIDLMIKSQLDRTKKFLESQKTKN